MNPWYLDPANWVIVGLLALVVFAAALAGDDDDGPLGYSY